MTPEQWQNVANCAHQRWEVLAFQDRPGVRLPRSYWQRRCGEWESWQLGMERAGRVPF